MCCTSVSILFIFNAAATTQISTLSLHDALPISSHQPAHLCEPDQPGCEGPGFGFDAGSRSARRNQEDRKSTRLNSSHTVSSYAVFCLKKKIAVHGSVVGFADDYGAATRRDAEVL